MNDFDFDARQKKIIANSARHKIGPTRKCTLPSDYLTKGEIEKMNGPVQTYNLSCQMTLAQYKAMPDDMQRAYMDKLAAHGGNGVRVAGMFGISPQAVRVSLSAIGYKFPHAAGTKRGDTEKWIKWTTDRAMETKIDLAVKELSSMQSKPVQPESETVQQVQREPIMPPTTPLMPPQQAKPIQPKSGTLEYSGPVGAVMDALSRVLPDNVYIRVTFDRIEDAV